LFFLWIFVILCVFAYFSEIFQQSLPGSTHWKSKSLYLSYHWLNLSHQRNIVSFHSSSNEHLRIWLLYVIIVSFLTLGSLIFFLSKRGLKVPSIRIHLDGCWKYIFLPLPQIYDLSSYLGTGSGHWYSLSTLLVIFINLHKKVKLTIFGNDLKDCARNNCSYPQQHF
jgi:hypothetical protein